MTHPLLGDSGSLFAQNDSLICPNDHQFTCHSVSFSNAALISVWFFFLKYSSNILLYSLKHSSHSYLLVDLKDVIRKAEGKANFEFVCDPEKSIEERVTSATTQSAGTELDIND